MFGEAFAVCSEAALENNFRRLQAMAGGKRIIAVVKANAYGHGAVPISRKLQELGCDMLAVACAAEAAELELAFSRSGVNDD